MKKIIYSVLAISFAIAGYSFNQSRNNANVIVCNNVEALSSGGDIDKPVIHDAYSRLLCGNENSNWTYLWMNGEVTGYCAWDDEIYDKIGTCVEVSK